MLISCFAPSSSRHTADTSHEPTFIRVLPSFDPFPPTHSPASCIDYNSSYSHTPTFHTSLLRIAVLCSQFICISSPPPFAFNSFPFISTPTPTSAWSPPLSSHLTSPRAASIDIPLSRFLSSLHHLCVSSFLLHRASCTPRRHSCMARSLHLYIIASNHESSLQTEHNFISEESIFFRCTMK